MLSRSVVLCGWEVLKTVHDDAWIMLDGSRCVGGLRWHNGPASIQLTITGEQLSSVLTAHGWAELLCTGKETCFYRMGSFILSKPQWYPEEEGGRQAQDVPMGCFVLENKFAHAWQDLSQTAGLLGCVCGGSSRNLRGGKGFVKLLLLGGLLQAFLCSIRCIQNPELEIADVGLSAQGGVS